MANIIEIDSGLEDLIPDLLLDIDENIKVMETAYAEKDFMTLAKVTHKLIGSTGGYGFQFLAELSRKMNTFAKEEKLEDFEKDFMNFKSYYNDLDIRYV